jgi:anti-anti-sigma factor
MVRESGYKAGQTENCSQIYTFQLSQFKLAMSSHIEVIPLSGILDSVSGNELRRLVDEAIQSGHRTILMDCSAVEFMDSSGLGALVMALKQTRSAGGRFALFGLNDQIKMLLKLTDMTSTFEIVANRTMMKSVL